MGRIESAWGISFFEKLCYNFQKSIGQCHNMEKGAAAGETGGKSMKSLQSVKNVFAMIMMCLCLTFAVVPAVEAHAETVQTENQVTEEVAAENAGNDEEAFLMIMMGGALLIILFAVISAVATVSSSVAVAANMDVDGE